MTDWFGHTRRARRKNLAKLAEYLESLPIDYEYFTMSDYVQSRKNLPNQITREEYLRNNGGIHTCGSVGCALGHGPSAGILFTDADFRYSVIAEELVPVWGSYVKNFIEAEHNREYNWMFSMVWAKVDNTHRGAAARIRYYLNHGVPEEFTHEKDLANNEWRDMYKDYIV